MVLWINSPISPFDLTFCDTFPPKKKNYFFEYSIPIFKKHNEAAKVLATGLLNDMWKPHPLDQPQHPLPQHHPLPYPHHPSPPPYPNHPLPQPPPTPTTPSLLPTTPTPKIFNWPVFSEFCCPNSVSFAYAFGVGGRYCKLVKITSGIQVFVQLLGWQNIKKASYKFFNLLKINRQVAPIYLCTNI